ncbi:MAG TPA: SprB repeat-containing protein, partial [Bacteroidia bacterium]
MNDKNYGRSVVQTADGGILFGGYNLPSSGFDQLLALKVNSSGNFQWAQDYNYGDMYSIVHTYDTGFAFCGGRYGSIAFSKTDKNGISCCTSSVTFLDSLGGASHSATDILKSVTSTVGTGGKDSLGGQLTILCEECNPPMPISISPDLTLCTGQSAQISITATGGVPPYTYSWSSGIWLNDSTISNPTCTPLNSGYFTYTATVADSKGCFKDTVMNVTVNFSNAAPISGNTLICTGDSTMLYTSSGQLSYQWSTGNVDTMIVVTPSASTTFSVIITGNFGCVDTFTSVVNVLPCNENFASEGCLKIGGPGDDYGNAFTRTLDGGYMLAGYSDSYGVGASDFYMVKLNSSGGMLWARTFGGSQQDIGNSI